MTPPSFVNRFTLAMGPETMTAEFLFERELGTTAEPVSFVAMSRTDATQLRDLLTKLLEAPVPTQTRQ